MSLQKHLDFNGISVEYDSMDCHWFVNTCLDNGLLQNRWEAIVWASNEPVRQLKLKLIHNEVAFVPNTHLHILMDTYAHHLFHAPAGYRWPVCVLR